MKPELTLRMGETIVPKAKSEAKRRGKSVSWMVADFIQSIGSQQRLEKDLPSTNASLVGGLKGQEVFEDDTNSANATYLYVIY